MLGRLLLPGDRSGPCPLVLLLGDAGASRDSASLDFVEPWIRSGFAIATIDLSLHGERRSAKFSERLLAAIAKLQREDELPGEPRDNGESLLVEFTRQSVCDLSRTLDGLLTLPAIDAERIGALGLGHGAAIVAIFASLDTRPNAVALAGCGAIRLPEIDPRQFVGRIGPRPVLVLERSPGGAGQALYDACADPKHRVRLSDSDAMLSTTAAEDVHAFFTDQLCAS